MCASAVEQKTLLALTLTFVMLTKVLFHLVLTCISNVFPVTTCIWKGPLSLVISVAIYDTQFHTLYETKLRIHFKTKQLSVGQRGEFVQPTWPFLMLMRNSRLFRILLKWTQINEHLYFKHSTSLFMEAGAGGDKESRCNLHCKGQSAPRQIFGAINIFL